MQGPHRQKGVLHGAARERCVRVEASGERFAQELPPVCIVKLADLVEPECLEEISGALEREFEVVHLDVQLLHLDARPRRPSLEIDMSW